jgi:hypothetical protein
MIANRAKIKQACKLVRAEMHRQGIRQEIRSGKVMISFTLLRMVVSAVLKD